MRDGWVEIERVGGVESIVPKVEVDPLREEEMGSEGTRVGTAVGAEGVPRRRFGELWF